MLAARFRRPWPIVLGILAATLLNHALAGLAGAAVASSIDPTVMRWVLAGSFLLMAAWLLVPDRLENREPTAATRLGVFGTTLVAFFLLEFGDKTQLATVVLGARFDSLLAVVMGTTLGMMLANVPAVLLGELVVRRLPLHTLRYLTAAVFLALGILTLFDSAGHLLAPPR